MAANADLSIPISFVSGRYLLFSVHAATYLRREHNIGGVLIGTLPQVPQQNVFLGLPVELMPEEARLLVERGVCVIVNEYNAHATGMASLLKEERQRYLHTLQSEGHEAAKIQAKKKEQQREAALTKLMQPPSAQSTRTHAKWAAANSDLGEEKINLDLFETGSSSQSTIAANPESAMGITPATSYPPLDVSVARKRDMPLPDVPTSYPVFALLHEKGYFLAPGIRFGCQYVAYPGDPLRFHSHFLVVGTTMDEEIDLMDIVNGGRLGTGVKKGFLLGGSEISENVSSNGEAFPSYVRTFSIEWAGM